MSETTSANAGRSLLLAVATISAATLAVQVLQTRLFSVMLWHHLTYMVVTVTLLGFAAGGSLLAILPRLGQAGGDPRVPVSVCCSLFGLSLVAVFAVLAHGQLDTLDIERDRSKYFWLFLQYGYLVIPFLCSGLAIAIALQQLPGIVHRTYFWNLLGSGVGSFLFVLLVRPLGGPGCLFLFASLGGAAGLLALSPRGAQRAPPAARALAIAATLPFPAALVLPGAADIVVPIRPAASKAQSMFTKYFDYLADYWAQRIPDYPGVDPRLRVTRWTPLCRLDTLPHPPQPGPDGRIDPRPRQIHVFQDGDAPTVVWSAKQAESLDYDAHFYGLGYRLTHEPRVLIIGPGGGNDVETALHYGAREVTAVDINGDTLDLVRHRFGDFTGHVYDRPGVTPVNSEGRSFLRRSDRVWDLLQMSGTDTYAALSSGSYIFSESYLYTVEAFDDFFAHLSDDGILSIIRFRFEPPREALKLVATAARSLRKSGVADLRRHFLIVHQTDHQFVRFAEDLRRNAADPRAADLLGVFGLYAKAPMRYAVVIARKKPFTAAEAERIAAALPKMNSELVRHELYYGAATRGEADQRTEYARLLEAIARGPEAEAAFYRAYAEDPGYDVTPATDDRPFFFNFHSWKDVKFTGSSDSGYEALTGSEPIGLYVLAALALQTAAATLLLVILPLLRLGFAAPSGGSSRTRILAFFASLGLAYLLVEITTIQRLVLYLGHPTYSLTVVLASFLVFSGLGAATAGRARSPRRAGVAASLAVVALLALHGLLLPGLLEDTLAQGEAARVTIAIAAIAPLAFVMGMPFPCGLAMLRGEAPGLVAWAFGVNGAASVVASILSIVVGMEVGFTVVFGLAGVLYLLASCAFPRPAAPAQEAPG